MSVAANKAADLSADGIAVLGKLRSLPRQDQEKIVACLIESLDVNDDGVDDTKLAEILRRRDEIRSGEATLIPADEAMKLYRERKIGRVGVLAHRHLSAEHA
jgi:putative addiction module component (TIGR02574 family)